MMMGMFGFLHHARVLMLSTSIKNCSLHSIIIRYYQKGNNCLQISGKAFVENADEALLNARLVEKNVLNKIVLLKVKILKAEYFKAKSSAKI